MSEVRLRCACDGACGKHSGTCKFVDGEKGVTLTSHVVEVGDHFLACQGCRSGLGDEFDDISGAVATRERERLLAAGQVDMFDLANKENG